MDVRKFIELSAEGETAAATDYLSNLLASRAFEALGERKQQLSRTIFGGRPESSEDTSEYEDIETEEDIDTEVE